MYNKSNEKAAKRETKLAVFLPSLNGGGAERSMLNLAHGVAERGYAVDLVLAQAKGPYLSGVHKAVRIVDLKASRVLTSLPALVRYLRKEQPQGPDLCAELCQCCSALGPATSRDSQPGFGQ